MSDNERGFTLIELLVVLVFFIALLVATLLLLRPDDYTYVKHNAKRRTDLAHIAQAINRYEAETGQSLPDVPTKVAAISSEEDQYDLCKYLVPKYMKNIPDDPLISIKVDKDGNPAADSCTEGAKYVSGYTILKNKDGHITLGAPVAKDAAGEVVEITIPKK